MNVQRAVRWSGSGICNGRQRLHTPTVNARFYSINGHCLPRPASKSQGKPPGHRSAVQTRSISLWGWGSSSKSTTDEFAAAHSAPQPQPPQSNVTDLPKIQEPAIDTVRTIKASHATSDQPEPSVLAPSPNPPHTPEPAALHDLENLVLSPHSSGSPVPAHDAALSSMTESYGYLRDVCGLDFGWGTTSLEEWAIEHIHFGMGLSWAASIPVLAIGIRLLLIKPILDSSDMTQRMKDTNPHLKPLRDQYIAAARARETAKAMAIKMQMDELKKEYGVKMWKMLLPMAIQVPLSFSAFRLLRNMAALPVPAFETEPWLWTTNLTSGDPYLVVPLITSGALYLSLRAGARGTPAVGMMKTLTTVFPFVNFIFMYFQPGSVQLFFMTSTLLSLAQTTAINNPRIRSMLGLYEFVNTSPTTTKPLTGAEAVGMNVARNSKIIDVTPTAASDASKSTPPSFIDKMVDNVKSGPRSVMTSLKETKEAAWGKTETKLEAKRLEKRKDRADKYEAQRRREKEWERENRNAANASASTRSATTAVPPPGTRLQGGMRIVDRKDGKRR